MTTVAEIERAISALSAGELDELYAWLDQNRQVDAQLKRAVEEGLFDDRIAQAQADLKAGNTRPLPRGQ